MDIGYILRAFDDGDEDAHWMILDIYIIDRKEQSVE